jgi:DNA-binding CsgD family transcriptional regulator
LTPHQLNALQRASLGQTHKQIARGLRIDEKSVGKLMTEVFRKLGARNMPNAILLACQAGLLDGRPQRHGDHAGFIAHQRRGEDPWACELGCPDGEREYRRGRWAFKREMRKAV